MMYSEGKIKKVKKTSLIMSFLGVIFFILPMFVIAVAYQKPHYDFIWKWSTGFMLLGVVLFICGTIIHTYCNYKKLSCGSDG
ncbi:MAG: hypothetical protein HN826_10810 [Methylococcales bacterium]|jgi:hypothetical protein|nr:hypothetical protein [Methylococcales bacterium]